MAVLVVPPFLQFFDQNGIPLAGGLVNTYAAGTVTPKATFTDNTEAVQAANPVVLDSAGRATIWGNGSYKFVVTDSSGANPITTDNVTTFSVPALSANAFFQSFSGDGATTSFSLSSDLGTDEKAVLVFVDQGGGKGYDAQNPSAFTLTGGGSPSIAFAGAPAVGTNNIYVFAPSLLLGAASTSAAAAATSATQAANSALLASQWASQTSGIVAATDFSAKAWAIGGTGVTGVAAKGASKEWATLTTGFVDTADYSAKAYAVGGTGVTGAVGAAKEWAAKVSATVDGTLFSAKEYAQGTQAATGGSAKNWAQQTAADVTGAAANSRSAKSWAQDNNTGATLGGSAKDWAQGTASNIDGTSFSAKEYAQGIQASTGGSAKNWAQQTGADVTGAAAQSRSAKSWAQDNLAGATYGGSAKDWAQSASLPDGVSKSAKSYAADASTSATAAASSATAASASAAAALAATVGLANEWAFASSIVMADPGTGNFRLDNATFGSVANIALSALSNDTGNPNLRTFIQTWDDSNHTPRGIIRLEKNATNFLILGVNGALTDNTTWLQIPVTVIASAGSFSAADVTFIGFTPYGNDGTGAVSTVSVVSANGFAGSVANPGTTPAITISTSVTGLLKGNGTSIAAAASGTDYSAGTSGLATGILKSTTTTGALSIAVAGDFPTLNQNTTGTAANVTTNANMTGDVTSIGNATTYNNAVPALKGGLLSATAGGTADALTATYSPAVTLADQTTVIVVPASNNATTTPTFAPNSLTAHTIVKSGGSALAIADMVALKPAILQYNLANTRWELLNPATGAGAGVLTVKKQVFLSSGTYTPSAGMLYCIIEAVGSGGAGGGSLGATGSANSGGGGGGAGSYARLLATAATIGASKTVTIGAGGTAGTGNAAGNAGADCSVTTLCVGKGGAGGGGAAALIGTCSGAGGAGGVAGTGDVTIAGNNGDDGRGSTIITIPAFGGRGGAGFFGGSTGDNQSTSGASVGSAGATNSGAGGSGGSSYSTNATAIGGVGAKGIVIITEFCSQ